MSLVERVQSILLRPRQTWPVIAAEPGDAATIYSRYLVILAAVSAVAGFIGMSLVGFGGVGATMRVPVMTGLVNMVLGFVLSLAMVWVVALVVNALAPTFGGTKDELAALKLVAYASTAGFLGGIFNLIPALAILGLLAALYSIYLLYTGVAVMMRSPPEKSVAYTAVVVVCAIVLGVVIAAVLALVTPTPRAGAVVGSGPSGSTADRTADREAVIVGASAMGDVGLQPAR